MRPLSNRRAHSKLRRPLPAVIALVAVLACTTDHTRRGYLQTIATRLDAPPRPVVIVPGFGVTRLFDPVTERYVWGTGRNTFVTKYEDDLDLPVSADGTIGHDRLVPRGFVGSRGPINIAWQLSEGLRRYGRYTPGADVFPFAYDWRLSARDNAAALADFVDRIRRERSVPKVDIVAHSAGSLVAMAYVKLGAGAASVDHLVLIAPVQRGVVDAFRVLVRPERFIRREFSARLVETWPSVPELLPNDGRFLIDSAGNALPFDAWTPRDWVPILGGVTPSFARSIEQARRFRDDLDRAPMPALVNVSVIAGDCVPTAVRALRRSDGAYVFYPRELRPDEKPLEHRMFERGDGTVPLSSARNGAAALLFCDGHQGIATDPNVQHALISILRDDR